MVAGAEHSDQATLEQCLDDIRNTEECFDPESGKCKDRDLAQQRLTDLQSNWKMRIRSSKGSGVERTLRQALTRINVKVNSRPDVRWLSELTSARIDIEFSLAHAAAD